MKIDNTTYMTAQAAANVLGVHRNTLHEYVKRGLLTAYRVGPRGRRRFRVQDVDNLRQPDPIGSAESETDRREIDDSSTNE